MSKVIMVGCDLHLRSMLLMFCIGNSKPQQASFVNTPEGREKMIAMLRDCALKHNAKRIIFVYEASSLGYGLCDLLYDNGIEAHVLSPTHLPKTAKQAKQKTDAKDALMLLEQVRGHVLAGNSLPVVWTPSQRLRDDRELVRGRIVAAEETTRVKLQILSMLKRRNIDMPVWFSGRWTKAFMTWLRNQPLDEFVKPVLDLLIERYELSVKQIAKLDQCLKKLSQEPRYRDAMEKLRKLPGVGQVTAIMFLTEIGDQNRFHNRRELAAYLGLCPSCHESGDAIDRKGHITRQGPSKLRKVLCQAVWTAMRMCTKTKADYDRIVGGKKSRGKKAVVALMRKLAIKMWHAARLPESPVELRGRGGPHELAA